MTAAGLAGVFRSFRDGGTFSDGVRNLAESLDRDRGTAAAYELIMESMEERRAGAA